MTLEEQLSKMQESIDKFSELQQDFTTAFETFCDISAEMTNRMMSLILFNMTQDDKERYAKMMEQIEIMCADHDEILGEGWEEFPTNNNNSEEE